MTPPDYRRAACCANCYYLGSLSIRCVKYAERVDLLNVCAEFADKYIFEQEDT